jgi:RND superfamily putative drug exporter
LPGSPPILVVIALSFVLLILAFRTAVIPAQAAVMNLLSMLLMGRANWWMPKWLERVVPDVSIEGAEFFQARDSAARGGGGALAAGAGAGAPAKPDA